MTKFVKYLSNLKKFWRTGTDEKRHLSKIFDKFSKLTTNLSENWRGFEAIFVKSKIFL